MARWSRRRGLVVAIAVLIAALGTAVAIRSPSRSDTRTSSTGVASSTSQPTTDPTSVADTTVPTTAAEPTPVPTTAPDTVPRDTTVLEDPGVVVAAVGDILCSPISNPALYNNGLGTPRNCRALGVAGLVQSLNPAAVLALGDVQYDCGRAEEFAAFDAAWGVFGSLVRPAIGNHEYGHDCDADDADAYFSYFGSRAGDFGHGWYSYDLGSWHVIVLNSECSYGGGAVGGCGAGSQQEAWLRQDLAAHQAQCSLAYWHEPRFSSGQHGNAVQMTVIWNDLVAAGADVVLSGHNHVYERFDPIGISYASPTPDPGGIREFVVGTGGKNLSAFGSVPPLVGEVVRNDDTYGVLGLTLRAGSYDWRFLPLDGGGGFTDSGSGDCH